MLKMIHLSGRIAVRFVNKLIEDQCGEPTGRQKIFIQDPKTPGEAQAVIYLEGREPKWVRIGNERYKDLWDFLGYCDIRLFGEFQLASSY
jgi:hypothetical protein